LQNAWKLRAVGETRHADDDGGYDVHPSSKPLWFTLETFECADITGFGRKLFTLSKDPTAAVLRGGLLPHVRPGGCYYRRFADPDQANNSLCDTPRAWMAIDCDDIPAPATPTAWLSDVPGAARHLVQMLPEELHDVTCIAQVTGSAGFSGDGLLRLRLWYALERECNCLIARVWAQAWNRTQGSRRIDWSVFTPAALHYIASPLLGPEVQSPVTGRWCLVQGRHDRVATLRLPPEPPEREPSLATALMAVGGGDGVGAPRRRGFVELVSQIGSIEFGFFKPISAALGRAAADRQDRDATVAAISAAVLAADPGHRSRATIQRYASRAFLLREFASFARRDDRMRRGNEAVHRHWFAGAPTTTRTAESVGRAG
jgi:hypothetical protein